MFHLWLKPRPPWSTGRLTMGHDVDSSAITMTPGCSANTTVFSSRTNSMASRFSRPPNSFGTHSPGSRE